MKNIVFAIALVAVSPSLAQAVTLAGSAGISGSATLLDFNQLAEGPAPLSLSGLNVSSNRFTEIMLVTNWTGNSGGGNVLATKGMTFTFDTLHNQLAFDFGGNTTNLVTATFYNGQTMLSSFDLTFGGNQYTSTPWVSYSFKDATGFDRVVFSAEKNKDWYYGIDNLAFDTKTTAVPLPATLPLLLAAAGGLFLAGMRRKTRG